MLAFDETELKQLPNNISPNAINRVFIWSGDAIVFPAIIKYIEDRKNAKQDIINGDVRAILVLKTHQECIQFYYLLFIKKLYTKQRI